MVARLATQRPKSTFFKHFFFPKLHFFRIWAHCVVRKIKAWPLFFASDFIPEINAIHEAINQVKHKVFGWPHNRSCFANRRENKKLPKFQYHATNYIYKYIYIFYLDSRLATAQATMAWFAIGIVISKKI